MKGQEEEDKDEEDKEQCSPVSVLDPLEEEEEDEDHHQHEPDHLNLLSCSFEVVQREYNQSTITWAKGIENIC